MNKLIKLKNKIEGLLDLIDPIKGLIDPIKEYIRPKNLFDILDEIATYEIANKIVADVAFVTSDRDELRRHLASLVESGV
jgi:hypothetical protein